MNSILYSSVKRNELPLISSRNQEQVRVRNLLVPTYKLPNNMSGLHWPVVPIMVARMRRETPQFSDGFGRGYCEADYRWIEAQAQKPALRGMTGRESRSDIGR
jgi:hypothetical protein